MYKKLSVLLILLLFCSFAIFDILSNSDKLVLKIHTASEIDIDLNNNGIFDTGETICLPNIEVFTADSNKNSNENINKLAISSEDAIKLGYLTDEFADNFLADKKVKLKFTGKEDQNCKFADITVGKENYRDRLINEGFTIYPQKNRNKFNIQLEKAKKIKLVRLNHKSNKYHKLDCKYGEIAQDSIILPSKYLADNAIPCKFCHIQENEKESIKTNFPLLISEGDLKLFLTDLTTSIKPDINCTSQICRVLLEQINSSKKSIDICLYGWNNIPAIYKALQDAVERGVNLRLVHDTSNNNYYDSINDIKNLATISSTDTTKFLMHNKFIIFDEKFVFTGSMNFSRTGLSGFNSNSILLINSVELAKIYKNEFEQMINGNFHQSKQHIFKNKIKIGNSYVTALFSPKDKIISTNIIPLIENAKHYIYIPTFILTHEKLSKALIKAHKRNVDVKIIIDATNVNNYKSKINELRLAGIPIKTENYAGKIHSKTIIIDDKFIIAGSMNFTASGENTNDENSLIIENERFARYYREYFEYLWNKIPIKYLTTNPSPESKDSIGSCSDGIDNDYDGKIDLQDNGCF